MHLGIDIHTRIYIYSTRKEICFYVCLVFPGVLLWHEQLGSLNHHKYD